MVGRHSSFLVTKRSLRNSDSSTGRRLRQVVQTKNLDDSVGLSRREEQELNKALYASLQENRRCRVLPGFTDTVNSISSSGGHSIGGRSSIKGSRSNSDGCSTTTTVSSSSSSVRVSSISKSLKGAQTRKHLLVPGCFLPKRLPRQSELTASLSVDESSQDSVRSSTSSHNGSKRKIHAQRKFAQGCSMPGMVSCTPVKSATPAVKMLSSRVPKTEDFLTFLCLRGSSILPAHLDFFNFSREELPACDESSRSAPYTLKTQREGTPDSSSTSSRANDEVAEAANVSTPPMTGRSGGGLLAKRSAARASAGTPETARGIVSLRQGLQRKVSTSSSSSSLAWPSASSSCLLPVSELTNIPPSRYRNKFYFTPEKTPSPSKASGIRTGEFTPPSLFSSATHMSSTYKFSPLVCCPSKFALNDLPFVSPVSQSSASSSSSSLSSSPVCGASKRKLRLPISSDAEATKKSPLGAFTPVSSAGRSVRSGSPSKVWRSRGQIEGQMGKVKSARKSLFGKQPSKIQQEAKRIMGKSTRRSSHAWNDYAKTKIRSKCKTKNESAKPAGRKRKRTDDSAVERIEKRGNNHNNKRRKREPRINRRASTRLREMMRHTKGSNSWTSSDNTFEVYNGRAADKIPSNHLATADSDDHHSPYRTKVDKGDKVSSSSSAKPRKPYKIRPLERVRTRAYSMVLASKLALKRARRETTAVRQKTKTDKNTAVRQKTKTEKNSEKGNIKKHDNRNITNQMRTRTAREKQQRTTLKVAEDVGRDYQMNSGSSLPLKAGVSSGSSSGGAGKLVMTKSNKDSKDRMRFAAKKTSQKKAKTQSSPTRVPLSQTTAEENSVLTFHPSEAEFSDPFTYINKIQPLAEAYGMCRIVPPPSWKLDSNKINEDIRFTSQVQHIHRLYQRWGTNVQHSAAINHHLLSEMSSVIATPQIGGIEIDLPQLYHLVEEAGGPKKMNDKKHWARIADIMNIPKQAMDRTMRIYDIYCRHVFPYATLSLEERKQLEDEVTAIHDLQTHEDDAVIRGKPMPVRWFNRIARNVQVMWFKEDVTPSQIESRYWHIVEEKSRHVAVQCGHINTRSQASAFPTRRDSMYSRHPWNLNNIIENHQCVLKYLGPVPGVTIPTLHMNMLFSTSCWSTDPHSLPYMQYLHTGSDIIWYCIPKSQHSKFRSAMTELAPSLVTHKPKWLKEDCVMVNPHLLRAKGVKIGRCVQSPRHFVVVFPGACTATISCGYSVAESVHYATSKWLPMGLEAALILSKSGEKELFSMSVLLCGLAQDENVDVATLSEAFPLFSAIVSRELELRAQLQTAGLRGEKRAVFTESPLPGPIGLKKRLRAVDDEKVCDICDRICYLSMVLNEQDEQVLCLEHGIRHVHRKKNLKSTRLFLRYNQTELETMVKDAKDRLALLNARVDQGTSTQENKTRTNLK